MQCEFYGVTEQYSPIVEQYSVDEFFLDCTQAIKSASDPISLANEIRERAKKNWALRHPTASLQQIAGQNGFRFESRTKHTPFFLTNRRENVRSILQNSSWSDGKQPSSFAASEFDDTRSCSGRPGVSDPSFQTISGIDALSVRTRLDFFRSKYSASGQKRRQLHNPPP